MPELPEIQTVCDGLRHSVQGRRIMGVRVLQSQLRWPINVRALQQGVKGQKIVGIRRRGKYILCDLENHRFLLLHLGMSGKINLYEKDQILVKHDHVVFEMDGGEQLRYNDVRRFGMIELCMATSEKEHPRLANLGFEPLHELSLIHI